MNEQWLLAAERYAQQSRDLGLSPEQVRPWIQTTEALLAFFRSSEGVLSAALLKASGNFIPLADIEEYSQSMVMRAQVVGGKTTHIDKLGSTFQQSEKQRVIYGWGSHGPSRIMTDPLGLGMPLPPLPVQWQDLSRAVIKSGKSQEEMFAHLRSELDKIAANAPVYAEL